MIIHVYFSWETVKKDGLLRDASCFVLEIVGCICCYTATWTAYIVLSPMVFRPYALEQNGQRHPTAIGFAIVPTHDGSMYAIYRRCSTYGIFTYIWVVFGVNVGKYSIHEVSGYGNIYHQYTPNVSIYASTMDPSWAMAAGQSDDLQEWVDNPIFLPWRGYSQR